MIIAENISKKYGEKQVLSGLSFEIPDGGRAMISGESGRGKTTLLRLICGIEKPDSGRLYGYERKNISYVFQEHRLFPWESALSNVTAPVGSDKAEKAREILSELGLENDLEKFPDELSGGMRQRVSIARALLHGKDILLLDEPFSALDQKTKELTASVIKKYSENKTLLLISHGENDAALLYDRYMNIKI